MNDEVASINHIKNTIIDLAIRFGPRLLIATLILVGGVIVARWASRWSMRGLHHLHLELEPPVAALLARVVWLLTFTLFLILALQNLGVELLPLIAGLSVAGAGIALATQGVLSNLVSGLSIIFTKPFRVGEYISIAGEEGVVTSVTLFSTTLSHVDRSHVVIPNRKISGEILHNFGAIRQLDVTVGIAYDTDVDAALATIGDVLAANPRVLRDPAPVVQAALLGEWSVTIGVRPWVLAQDYVAATGELNSAILDAFRRRGFVIPVPQREVRVISQRA
jgi:small conductance mechanosensitive channel